MFVSFLFLGLLGVLALSGCGTTDGRQTACLSGNNDCGTLTENETNIETQTTLTKLGPLFCSVFVAPQQVEVNRIALFQVITSGAEGAITVQDSAGISLVTNGTGLSSFTKTYGPEKAGQTIQDVLTVRDSLGRSTQCGYQIQVKAASGGEVSSGPALGCTISALPTAPQVGSVTQFELTAVNATGPATFQNFYGNYEWLLSDSYIQRVTDTQSSVWLMYNFAGTKTVRVQVTSGGQSAVCSAQFSAF